MDADIARYNTLDYNVQKTENTLWKTDVIDHTGK